MTVLEAGQLVLAMPQPWEAALDSWDVRLSPTVWVTIIAEARISLVRALRSHILRLIDHPPLRGRVVGQAIHLRGSPKHPRGELDSIQ